MEEYTYSVIIAAHVDDCEGRSGTGDGRPAADERGNFFGGKALWSSFDRRISIPPALQDGGRACGRFQAILFGAQTVQCCPLVNIKSICFRNFTVGRVRQIVNDEVKFHV